MDDWHILWGKAIGVFRRCLPIWFLLAGHILFFIFVGYIHPIAIIQVFILIAGLVVFLTGIGLYFSAFFKRTTSAVVANFAFCTAIWLIIPLFLGLLSSIQDDDDSVVFMTYISANPVLQVATVMEGAAGQYNARTKLSRLEFDWPMNVRDEGAYSAIGILLIIALIYASVGFVFAWRAKCRFRRNIF
jgi:hypothetical protein